MGRRNVQDNDKLREGSKGTLTNNEIVEELYRSKFLKKTIQFIARESFQQEDTLEDLQQDIILQLLTMDNGKLNAMRERNQLNFFIVRIVINNIRSVTSPYYQTYRRLSAKSDDISDYVEMIEDD